MREKTMNFGSCLLLRLSKRTINLDEFMLSGHIKRFLSEIEGR